MVSPLKTWHHPQPKGLWPAVTGLAVVTHIGILGLSLPYALNLMRSGESQVANFVPVELIEVDPVDVVEDIEADAPSDVTETKNRAAVESTAQPTTATPNNVLTTPTKTEDVSAVPVPEVETKLGAESSAGPEVEPELEKDTQPETESSSTDDTAPASTPEPVNEPASSENYESNVESSTPSEENSPEVTEPPVIPGDQALPTPGEGGTAPSSAQMAYVRVVGHSYVPKELRRDIADTLPEPDAYPDVQLDSESVGCGRIDFPAGQVAYRVVVDPTGAVRQALPWNGGIEGVQMNEGESAIACLIESAGFGFTSATSAGTPVANSDLILTLDVIESGSN
ncbi:MAG: hypothetical protein AAFZ17_08600 [Cyanobacteria bacterium J06650_10]